MRRSRLLVVLATVLSSACAHAGAFPAPAARVPAVAPHGYTTVGNAIYDSTGALRVFHGVNRPSLEWRRDGAELSPADFALMRSEWKADLVRIPLNQDFWLEGAKLYDAKYRDTVDQTVRWALAAGLHVLLDLHWSDRGDLQIARAAQQRMPDANSIEFWKQVATKYRNESHVFFDLYNEPYGVSWEIWRNGGKAEPYHREGKSDDGFTAVGLQQLYDAVRGTGAENLVFIGGLDWGYDLSGVPGHRITGHNIVYSTHPYQWKGDWWGKAFFLAESEPVFMGEFGSNNCGTQTYREAIEMADRAGASWAAWAWWGGAKGNGLCTFPTVIRDWTGSPTPMGEVVKAALARYGPSGLLPQKK